VLLAVTLRPRGWRSTNITPSGDKSGATDTTIISSVISELGSPAGSVISELGSPAGLISLAAGDYCWTCGSVVVSNPGVFIAGAGINATTVHAVGTGDTINL
jgi:hypothetical protein